MAVEHLSEVLQDIEQVRLLGSDLLGTTAPIVKWVGWIVTAGIAIFTIIFGKGFGAPPMPDISKWAVRIFGAVAGVSVVTLLVWSRNGGTALDFTVAAVCFMAIGIVGFFIYVFLRFALCFKCDPDPMLYVKGFRLQPLARRVLRLDSLDAAARSKELADLPDERALPFRPAPLGHNHAPPASATDYFCGSGRQIGRIWTPLSHSVALTALYVSYFFVLIPITVGVASASIALSQPQLKERQTSKEDIIELPADILFDFNSANIRPSAVPSLEQAAEILQLRSIKEARIEGHTDSRGSAHYNQQLSERRAEAVKSWLVNAGGLSNIRFALKGFGSTRPIDNSDNPEGAQKNRRVVIAFDRQ